MGANDEIQTMGRPQSPQTHRCDARGHIAYTGLPSLLHVATLETYVDGDIAYVRTCTSGGCLLLDIGLHLCLAFSAGLQNG